MFWWDLVPHVAALLMAVSFVGVVFATRLMGTSRKRVAILGLLGLIMSLACYRSTYLALAICGLCLPLFSHNILAAWTVSTLGVDSQRRKIATLLVRGGPWELLLITIINGWLSVSPAVFLVMLVPYNNPIAWMGFGMLASPLFSTISALRLAFNPTPEIQDEMNRIRDEAQADSDVETQ